MAKQKSKEKQRLKKVQSQFADWRENRKPREQIPGWLWKSAVSLAGSFSINELSKALRLNHTALKNRVASSNSGSVAALCRPAFIEFPTLNSTFASAEAMVEIEKAGARMKVHVKGHIDVLSLAQAFWSQQP